MFRPCYLMLLRIHPRGFRDRFAEEMLEIYDNTGNAGMRLGLFLDAIVSLGRQWLFRPRTAPQAAPAAIPTNAPSIPSFFTFDSVSPRRSALTHGALLTVLCFAGINFAISRANGQFPRLIIGALYPRPHVLPVERSSIQESEPTTRVKVNPVPMDPLFRLADIYFKAIPVLKVLDSDGDRILSAREMDSARLPLTMLDADRDGRLTAEECGFSPGGRFDEQFKARMRAGFMRMNPVLAALDSDHNGEISASEIEASAVSLRSLDKNGDGSISPAEVLPNAGDNRTALIMSRLDRDGDLRISRQELQSERAGPIREMLERADQNRDGVVTALELRIEVGRSLR